MDIKIAYGKQNVSVTIPENNVLGVLAPKKVKTSLSEKEEILSSLENPIGSKRLCEIVKPEESVCIVTSDITRPMPSSRVLPYVIGELHRAGVKDGDITIVFALGNHRKHNEAEKRYIVGDDIYEKIRCVDADQKRTVNLGKTSFGTPVDIFDAVALADRVICVGNIEYHYFAGYSGGTKAVMPGVSTAGAIQANHSKMVEDSSAAGSIDGNNVRADIDEAANFIKIDFILNVVLDENKRIVKSFAGHHIKAHREGCAYLDTLYKVNIAKKADIVLVSAGGYPKDINLYQAQKALDNAKYAVRDGGVVIVAAACPEGLGEKVFERWMTEAKSPADVVERISRHFELGGHKAAAIAMVQQKADVYLVSEMNDSFVESLFFKPFDTVQSALDAAFAKMGRDAKVIIMPYGGSTLPVL
ncbi:MAG: nickel-dependent lactate racemase [Christensenellales bacterium]